MSNDLNESENNINKIDKENLYKQYFCYPKDIDSVYYIPGNTLHTALKGTFISNKDAGDIYFAEKCIRDITYRLPNLNLKTFFDLKNTRADIVDMQQEDINQIHQGIYNMLSDVDNIKDVQTKKRVLYYFRSLANMIENGDFADVVMELVARTAKRNKLATVSDLQFLIKDSHKQLSDKEMTDLINELINQTKIEFCATGKDTNTTKVVMGLNDIIADNEQKLIDKSLLAHQVITEKAQLQQELWDLRSAKKELEQDNQDLKKQNNELKTKNAKLIRSNEGFGAALLMLQNKTRNMQQGLLFGQGVEECKSLVDKMVIDAKEWHK